MLVPNVLHQQRFSSPSLTLPLEGEGRVGVITGGCAHVTEEDAKRDR
ncbi:hypothetical protein ISS37_10025 [candidate division KSB1 bacterium]|nr:hypothetical protein [candidate division KSB1 bacterium]